MTAYRETAKTTSPRSPSACAGEPALSRVVPKQRGHQLKSTPGSAGFPGWLEKLMEMLVMFTGLVSGVYKVTWSVSKGRKISLLKLRVEILLPNATNRPGDLRYNKDLKLPLSCITFSWTCSRMGNRKKAKLSHVAYLPFATAALWGQTKPHVSMSCGGIQRICRHRQMHESHVPSGLLAATELVPNPWEALCFSEPLFFTPLLKKKKVQRIL